MDYSTVIEGSVLSNESWQNYLETHEKSRLDHGYAARPASLSEGLAMLLIPRKKEAQMPARIRELPATDRPRERLWKDGVDGLADREILALILRTGSKGQSALDLAGNLLVDHGGLAGIARLRPEELAAVAGIGPSKAALLVAAFELGRRHLREAERSPQAVRRPADIAALVLPHLSGRPREEVLALILDGGRRPKRVVRITSGSVDRSLLPVRDVLNAVLRNDGVAFALAHNHPSGDATPSKRDLAVTEELTQAAGTVGLCLIDHLVVGDSNWTSSREFASLDS